MDICSPNDPTWMCMQCMANTEKHVSVWRKKCLVVNAAEVLTSYVIPVFVARPNISYKISIAKDYPVVWRTQQNVMVASRKTCWCGRTIDQLCNTSVCLESKYFYCEDYWVTNVQSIPHITKRILASTKTHVVVDVVELLTSYIIGMFVKSVNLSNKFSLQKMLLKA